MALNAFSTSNAMATATINYVDGLASVPDDWRNIVDYRTDQSGALRVTSMASIGEVASWDGTADLSSTATAAGSAGTKTIDIVQFASQVSISRLNSETIPGLVGGMAKRMGVAVANTYRKQVFAGLEAATSSLVTGDGLSFFNAEHTMPGLTGSAVRSNVLTSALDPAGVAAAVAASRAWKDATGAPYDLSSGGYWLVCPVELEEAARAAVASPFTLTTVVTSGAPAQGLSNMVSQYLTQDDIIVANVGISDTNAWFLLPKQGNPLLAWSRLDPLLRQTVDEDTLQIKLTVDFAFAVDCNVEPIGIFSNPS